MLRSVIKIPALVTRSHIDSLSVSYSSNGAWDDSHWSQSTHTRRQKLSKSYETGESNSPIETGRLCHIKGEGLGANE